MASKPEILKIEKYVTELPLPKISAGIQPGESPEYTIEFPKCKRFATGKLSKTFYTTTFIGSFSRKTCELDIKFILPLRIKSNELTMKPFRVELLAKDIIISDFLKEFPVTQVTKVTQQILVNYANFVGNSCELAYYNYSTKLNLSSVWRDSIDLIRITWNIQVKDENAEYVINGLNENYNEVSKTDQFIAMKKEMSSFHNSEDLSDAIIRCGSEAISVHRFVLALASPVFRSMFGTDMKEKKDGEVIVEDIDVKILKLLLKWIYTGKIEVFELKDLMDLFKAAHKYQVEPLKNFCIAQICEIISPFNVLEVFEFSKTFEEVKIQKQALEIMKKNKDEVFADRYISEEFVIRYPKVMLELLKA